MGCSVRCPALSDTNQHPKGRTEHNAITICRSLVKLVSAATGSAPWRGPSALLRGPARSRVAAGRSASSSSSGYVDRHHNIGCSAHSCMMWYPLSANLPELSPRLPYRHRLTPHRVCWPAGRAGGLHDRVDGILQRAWILQVPVRPVNPAPGTPCGRSQAQQQSRCSLNKRVWPAAWVRCSPLLSP